MMDKRLTQLLSTVFDMKQEQITESLTQQDVPKWDSLTHMDLITVIEKEYSLELSMDDIFEMTSIKNIISVLDKNGVATND